MDRMKVIVNEAASVEIHTRRGVIKRTYKPGPTAARSPDSIQVLRMLVAQGLAIEGEELESPDPAPASEAAQEGVNEDAEG